MSEAISNQEMWRAVMRRQSLANVQRWLDRLEAAGDPSDVAVNDYDNLLRALETTLESPDTFDMAFRLVRALYFVAVDYADWDRWLIYLEKALVISQELGRPAEEAALLVQIGDILYHIGELERAEEHYERGAEMSKALEDEASYAGTLARLAVLHDLRGEMDAAVALCQEAMSIAESVGAKLVVAQANLNLSNIHRRAQNWGLGLSTAQTAREHFKAMGKGQLANKALLNIVAIWAELGEWEKVDEVSEELMNSLTAAGDIRTLSLLKNNLGLVAFNQGNFMAAESSWQEALNLHSQIQEPTELATLYNNLGMVYTRMQEWATANDMLIEAISAHRKLGDTYNWANSMDNLADLHEAMGDRAACRRVLIEAQDGLSVLSNMPHARELLDSIRIRLAALEKASS